MSSSAASASAGKKRARSTESAGTPARTHTPTPTQHEAKSAGKPTTSKKAAAVTPALASMSSSATPRDANKAVNAKTPALKPAPTAPHTHTEARTEAHTERRAEKARTGSATEAALEPAPASAKSTKKAKSKEPSTKPSSSAGSTPWDAIPLSELTLLGWQAPEDDSTVGLAVKPLAHDTLLVHVVEAGALSDSLSASRVCALFKDVGGASVIARREERPFACWVLRMPPEGVKKVLACTSMHPTVSPHDGHLLGLRGWLAAAEASKLDPSVLETAVNDYMIEFDNSLAEADAAKSAAVAEAMDADGFTVVTYKKPSRAADAAEMGDAAEAANLSENQKRKKKRGSVIKTDFYAFQRQEDKLSKLASLRSRFAEDKERIRKLTDARKFKPY